MAGAKVLGERFDQPLDWWTQEVTAEVYRAMRSSRREVRLPDPSPLIWGSAPHRG
jgi:hypothetical protein